MQSTYTLHKDCQRWYDIPLLRAVLGSARKGPALLCCSNRGFYHCVSYPLAGMSLRLTMIGALSYVKFEH